MPGGGAEIEWYDNAPLVSYALPGPLPSLRQAISIRYPIVELLTGLLSSSPVTAAADIDLLPALLLLTTLVAITAIDLDRQPIPHVLSLPGIAVGLLISTITGRPAWLDSLLGTLVGETSTSSSSWPAGAGWAAGT